MGGTSKRISPKERVAALHQTAGLTVGKDYTFVGIGKYGFYNGRRYKVSSIVAAVLVTKGRITIGESKI